ncbi:MAG TPA: helix-turn-helix domain-containing protein [Candidatus Binataceae bacterium]|nr:helix-turn-helix domain-containing protein [Candidatus Binataceae bacterium]
MKSLGKAIRERRRILRLTLRQLAARVRFEDGHTISEPYLNDIEHGFRNPPREHIITQLAAALEINHEVFFYLAGKLPPDLCEREVSNEQLEAAFHAFRLVLTKVRRERSGDQTRAMMHRNSTAPVS